MLDPVIIQKLRAIVGSDYSEQLRQDGLSEDEAVDTIDLSKWDLSVLPSFHDGKLIWATAENNIRWVYLSLKNSVDN